MKYLMCSLFIAAAAAHASDTISGHSEGAGGGFHFPETDFVYDSYVYNPEQVMSTVGASFGDYAVIDDFTYQYGDQFWLEYYFCWAVTTGSVPTALELFYVADSGGVPSGAPITQVSYAVDCVDSGYDYYGYTVWITELYILDNPWFDSPCWLGTHRSDGGTWYPIGGTSISGSQGYRTTSAGWSWVAFSSSGISYGDLFKMFGNYGLPLLRDTWAGIKNSF